MQHARPMAPLWLVAVFLALVFPSLSADGASGLPRCQSEMALVSWSGVLVCIDRYEAAVVQVLPHGHTRPWPFDRPVERQTVRAIVQPGIKPQAYISDVQASAACQRAGKRLCTAEEWQAACQGPQGFTYPYGNTYMPGTCNEGRATNPVNDCFGSGPEVYTDAHLNHRCCD